MRKGRRVYNYEKEITKNEKFFFYKYNKYYYHGIYTSLNFSLNVAWNNKYA